MTHSSWQRQRLRYVCKVNPNRGKKDTLSPETEVSFVPMESIGEQGSLSLERTRRMEDVSSGYTYFEDGDVVFAKITPCFENGKGTLANNLVNGIAFGTTELHVLRPLAACDGKFLYYLTCSDIFRKHGESFMYGAGGQKRVPDDFVRDYSLHFPPLPIQKAIAAYLDKETARIDALIAKKERQIELLQEKRQAIITRAITKGLDPKAKMKHSGVEWIGEIPEGWEVKRLKFVLSVPLQYGANESAEEDDPTLPRYIRITDFDDSGILRDETFKSLPTEIAKDYLLTSGDILFARSGATVGKTFQYKGKDGKACFAGYLIRAKPEPNIIYSDYLYFFTKCSIYENWKNSIFIQATIQNIGAEKYANLIVPVPPVPVQIEIISFLKTRIEGLTILQDKLSSSITLLHEYRSSLITAAVSGQIDVSQEVSK